MNTALLGETLGQSIDLSLQLSDAAVCLLLSPAGGRSDNARSFGLCTPFAGFTGEVIVAKVAFHLQTTARVAGTATLCVWCLCKSTGEISQLVYHSRSHPPMLSARIGSCSHGDQLTSLRPDLDGHHCREAVILLLREQDREAREHATEERVGHWVGGVCSTVDASDCW